MSKVSLLESLQAEVGEEKTRTLIPLPFEWYTVIDEASLITGVKKDKFWEFFLAKWKREIDILAAEVEEKKAKLPKEKIEEFKKRKEKHYTAMKRQQNRNRNK